MPMHTRLTLRATTLVPLIFGLTAAQQPSRPSLAAVAGTYAQGTTKLPPSKGSGCWLETAPVRADSMHLQVLCRKPAPGYHLGVIDARVPVHGDTLIYERRGSTEPCRITVRFAHSRAIVAQDGSDIACGFGAFVNLGGTYARLSNHQPRFDLFPIEKASASRPRGQSHVPSNPSR
jgi:hypothetical protein